jgi:hypothetical protein
MLTEFGENFTGRRASRRLPIFKPSDHTATTLDTMLDQVTAWSTALAPLRGASG